MNTWIAEKDLMKHHYLIKKRISTANYLQKILLIKTIRMLNKCLKN